MVADVLVVDDDYDIREIIAQVLDVEDIPCRTAQNGVEALIRIAEGLPAVILLDMMLPEVDGPTVCRELEAQGRRHGVAVVVLTAAPRARYFERFCGADDVLGKHSTLAELYAVVERRLGRHA